jgi:hypothetical protein
LRELLDSYEVTGLHGTRIALVLQVSQTSLRDMDTAFMKGRGFEQQFVKSAIKELLETVDFLHTEAQAIHTGRQPSLLPSMAVLMLSERNPIDTHPGNLLLGIEDNSLFKRMEDTEFSSPVPRKELSDRTIYFSRLMKPKVGPLLLSVFGETRLGPGPHAGAIMPFMYRAPETLYTSSGVTQSIYGVLGLQ